MEVVIHLLSTDVDYPLASMFLIIRTCSQSKVEDRWSRRMSTVCLGVPGMRLLSVLEPLGPFHFD